MAVMREFRGIGVGLLVAGALALGACSPSPGGSSDGGATQPPQHATTAPVQPTTIDPTQPATVDNNDAKAAIRASGLTDWASAVETLGPLTMEAYNAEAGEGLPEGSELLVEDSGFLDRAEATLLGFGHTGMADQRMLAASNLEEQHAVLREAMAALPSSAWAENEFIDSVLEGLLKSSDVGIFSGSSFGPAVVTDPRFRLDWHLSFTDEEDGVYVTAMLHAVSTYWVDGSPIFIEREIQYAEPLDEIYAVSAYRGAFAYLSSGIDRCASIDASYMVVDTELIDTSAAEEIIFALEHTPDVYDPERMDRIREERIANGAQTECDE